MECAPKGGHVRQPVLTVLECRLFVRQQTPAINALRALSELGVIAAVGTTKVAELIERLRDATDAPLPKAARLPTSKAS